MNSLVCSRSLQLFRLGVGGFSPILVSHVPQMISSCRFSSGRSFSPNRANKNEHDLDASHTQKRVSGAVVIPEGYVGILERFGRFSKELKPGLNIFFPITKTVRLLPTKQISLTVEPQKVFTKDNVQVSLEGKLIVKVECPYKAAYKADKPFELTKIHAQAIMLELAGETTLEGLSSKRSEINNAIVEKVNEIAKEYGIACLSYAITSIEVSQNTLDEMARMLASDRAKRETELLAEGRKKATVLEAEARAEAFEILQTACKKNPEAVIFSLQAQALETWKGMLGKGNTIVTTTNTNPAESMLSNHLFAKLLRKSGLEEDNPPEKK